MGNSQTNNLQSPDIADNNADIYDEFYKDGFDTSETDRNYTNDAENVSSDSGNDAENISSGETNTDVYDEFYKDNFDPSTITGSKKEIARIKSTREFFRNFNRAIAEDEINIADWESRIKPMRDDFKENIRTINETENKSTIVISINTHGSFDYANEPIKFGENEFITTDNLPTEITENVFILSEGPTNTITFSNGQELHEITTELKKRLHNNMPILPSFCLARRMHTSRAQSKYHRDDFKKDLEREHTTDPNKKYVEFFVKRLNKKYTYEIFNPISNMYFASDLLSTQSTSRRWIGLDINVLDVRYPISDTQLAFSNTKSREFTDFYDTVVTERGDVIHSTLYKIISTLRDTYGFKYVFIVLSACRGGECENTYGKMISKMRSDRNHNDVGKTDDEICELNTIAVRNRAKKRLQKTIRKNYTLTQLGGSARHRRLAKSSKKRVNHAVSR